MDNCDIFRESSDWWSLAPYRETRVFYDQHSIRRTEEILLPSLARGFLDKSSKPYIEDHREEVSVRIRKVRDEKVALACGHPTKPEVPEIVKRARTGSYCLLHALSGYSFGRSVLHAEEIPAQAAQRGACAALLADSFTLCGAVEFARTAKKVGIKSLIGASLELVEGGEIVLVARSKRGYTNLSQLVTECHLNEPRNYPLTNKNRLERYSSDIICLTGFATTHLYYLVAKKDFDSAQVHLRELINIYGKDNVFVQIEYSYFPRETYINKNLVYLAQLLGIICVAGRPVQHLNRSDLPGVDMLASIHSLCLIDDIVERKPKRDESQSQGRFIPLRPFNAERFLLTYEELCDRYVDQLDLVENTLRLSERCDDNVLPDRTTLPAFSGDDPQFFRTIVQSQLRVQSAKEEKRVFAELSRITKLGFSTHFLIAWDMCRWAKEMGIHFSARGSVVDSAVAYQLGFSRINAFEHQLHFDRFLPSDGSKRPDIDIDFEAKRREDIRQYLANKYGRDRVATVAAVGTFSTRGIVREVGKVMGIPDSAIRFLSKRIHGGVSPEKLEAALSARPELRDSNISSDKIRWIIGLSECLADIPRNMRAHSSGVIISSEPISHTVPVMASGTDGVPIIQWDKRSAKHFFDKFDILCLRGQDVLSDTEEQIRRKDLSFCVNDVPIDDPETYRAIRSGQLIGIPQSASPAMRQAHVRLRTENLTDASLVQAGIRPGVGGAVKINELIARRRGKPYSFDHPLLAEILDETYGIIVFQEQVDRLLQTFGGYTSGEAEEIRESIHKRRRESFASQIKYEVLKKVVDNGYSQAIAEQVYELVAGFEGYGFAQGHALAFAEISVRSVWCQQHFPSEYFAALLNAQPAGYYGPATIANEARLRGVRILPPCVNLASDKFLVENVRSGDDPQIWIPNGGIRVGLLQIGSVSESVKQEILDKKPFTSFFDFVARVFPPRDELEQLILCGALDSLSENRRAMLWAIPDAMKHAESLRRIDMSCLDLGFAEPPMPKTIDDFGSGQRAIYERRILGLDIHEHLMGFERERILLREVLNTRQVIEQPPGTKSYVVGNPIRLRFPPTKSGKRVVFFDLEDEFGLLNVTCFDAVYQRDGHAIVCSPYITILGETQDRDGHMAFLAHRVFPYRPHLATLATRDTKMPIKAGDYLVG